MLSIIYLEAERSYFKDIQKEIKIDIFERDWC